jgi:hypothetical protein
MQQKNGSKCIYYIKGLNSSAPKNDIKSKNDLKSNSQYFDLKSSLKIMAVKMILSQINDFKNLSGV